MSFKEFDKTGGRTLLHNNVSGRNKPKDRNFDEVSISFREYLRQQSTSTGLLKGLDGKKKFTVK